MIFFGVFVFLVVFFFSLATCADTARIEAIIAITPPVFDGIDRKIAYADRKYHSG
jgi:hypothetical protein